MIKPLPVLTAAFVACVTPLLAQAQQLPYNPTYLIRSQDSKIYQFSPSASSQFSVYDVTNTLGKDSAANSLTDQLPFLTDNANSYVPVAIRGGLTVFSGECSAGEQELGLWTYGFGAGNQTWSQMKTTSSDAGLSANFLAAGFAFPSETAHDEDSLYVFGGMCPQSSSNASAMQANATYSNTMLTISPEPSDDYEVSLTGTRSPPIAEAGLSITPLVPTSAKADNTTEQQNFVLIGGHTQNAFINMSQVALFSMPEQAWAFVGINQPPDSVVEPRSGHSAAITEDGSKIIVFGGWVGDITNPATPALAILNVGQSYGGNGSWSWMVPVIKNPYTGGAAGVYGHGAVMLPGDIMMVTGGYQIITTGSSKSKRGSASTMFYNTSSSSWSDSYTNPEVVARAQTAHSGLTSSQKTGLGAGLGIGIAVLIAGIVAWLFHARWKREQRRIRERQLREMALGTNDAFSTTEISRRPIAVLSGNRSASWGGREEQRIGGNTTYDHGPSPVEGYDESSYEPNKDVNSTGGTRDIAGPSVGMRNSLRTRGPPSFGSHLMASAPGVYTIQEVEERSERGSERPRIPGSRPLSDPFKDPGSAQSESHIQAIDEAAQQRRTEVQTWVDDWQYAAESLNLSRTPSKATSYQRTYSNLSAFQSSSSSNGKESDRTNSNLSDRSTTSNLSKSQGASGTMTRTISQRSGSAGYALFSSAAAAMGRIAGRQDHASPGVERSASKRAVSTGDLTQMRKRSNSMEQSHQPQLTTPMAREIEEINVVGEYFPPPESPVKDFKQHVRKRSNSFTDHVRSTSLTSQSKKAFGALSQGARRILTGTGGVSVQDKVSTIEGKSTDNSPTKATPEMRDTISRQVSSSGAEFWKHRQGAKDWEGEGGLAESSGTVRRRSGRPIRFEDEIDSDKKSDEQDDWDIETAVQQRVVQVMFTVPKERLRVVNADNLSLLSRSDTHASRDSNKSDDAKQQERDMNRMSRLTEADQEDDSTTVVGSSLHPDSALTVVKGKDRASDLASLRSHKSGATIGKAL